MVERWRRSALALIGFAAFFHDPACADAPTHRLTMNSASIRTDCANGKCSDACSIKATLTNVGHSASVPIAVNIWFKDGSTDAGEAAVSLQFPALKVGAVETATDEAAHYKCQDVSVMRVEVVCPETGVNQKCSSFYNVAVPELQSPKIQKQDVEGK